MIVKLLTEHHFEFLSLRGGCGASCGSTVVKMPHCWKSHAMAHNSLFFIFIISAPHEWPTHVSVHPHSEHSVKVHWRGILTRAGEEMLEGYIVSTLYF